MNAAAAKDTSSFDTESTGGLLTSQIPTTCTAIVYCGWIFLLCLLYKVLHVRVCIYTH